MPKATATAIREQIVQRRQAGESYRVIGTALGVPPRTVRKLWKAYERHGTASLVPRYAACGTRGPRCEPALYEAALALKRHHPRWGAGLIRVQLAQTFSGVSLPHERTLQRWFRAAGVSPLRSRRPAGTRERGQEPHAVWAIDAKEQFAHQDGSASCAFSVVDEASGAALATEVFPPEPLGSGRADRRAGPVARNFHPVGAAVPPAGR